MKNDFKPVAGHRFDLRAARGAAGCQVLQVEPNKTLSSTWGNDDLASVVTRTLSAASTGTRLRIEQSGFRPDRPRSYHGARAGWPRFPAKLEHASRVRFGPGGKRNGGKETSWGRAGLGKEGRHRS